MMSEGHPQLTWFFLFALSINGLVTTAILLIKNRSFPVANLLLALNLLGISFISIMITMFESKLILEVPRFYRLPSPLYYAMFPAAYLYVKLIVEDRTHLKRTEYLHFLPAVFHLLEMLPFYLLDTGEKLRVLSEVYQQKIIFYSHKEGLLPAYLHNIVRGAMALGYSFLIWRFLRSRKATLISSRFTSTVVQWLYTFMRINTTIGLVTLAFLTATAIQAETRSFALHVVYLSVMLITNFHLLTRPDILYGMPRAAGIVPPQAPISSANDDEETVGSNGNGSAPVETIRTTKGVSTDIPAFILDYKTRVHEYLMSSRRFLEPGYTLQDLARETAIPKHHMQLLIFKGEGKKFSEFILDYRIRNIKDLIANGALKNKTLQALAVESGFSSKSAFIRSVKKLTGKTPKEYFITH